MRATTPTTPPGEGREPTVDMPHPDGAFSFQLRRGERLVVEEPAAASGGERVVLRVELAPGTVVGRHAHRPIREVFTCLAGRVEFHLDGRTRELRPGDTVTVAPGRIHGFRNASPEPAALRLVGTPGTETEYGLRVGGLLARDGFAPNRRAGLLLSAVLLDRVGLSFPPLPRWLFRLLVAGLAALGRWRGHERFLLGRYPEYARFLAARRTRAAR